MSVRRSTTRTRLLWTLMLPLVACVLAAHAVDGAVETGDGICESQYVSSTISDFDRLRDCRVIEGNLRIVLFDNFTVEQFADLSFPKLVEITEYLLFFHVSGLQSVGKLFPNLAVIRGQELVYNYALILYDMSNLTEVGLHNLRHIERGAVRIQRNGMLCYADTVDWDLIATSAKEPKRLHEISENMRGCPRCRPDIGCPIGSSGIPLCWNSEKCQKVCNTTICGKDNSCLVNNSSTCCHSSCIGGCTGPTEADCIACRHIVHEGRCRSHCPAQAQGLRFLEFNERRCITFEECLQKTYKNESGEPEPYKSTGTGEEPGNSKKPGKCTKKCPTNFEVDQTDKTVCKRCKAGRCRSICYGGPIRNAQDAQKFRGCTHIRGGIEINILKSSGSGMCLIFFTNSSCVSDALQTLFSVNGMTGIDDCSHVKNKKSQSSSLFLILFPLLLLNLSIYSSN